MFFQDKSGEFHPISRIVSMRRSYKYRDSPEVHTARVYMADATIDGSGTSLKVEDETIGEILRLSRPCIPAQPGFVDLEIGGWGDEELFVVRHPVLGWRVREEGGATPIIFDEESAPMTGLHGLLNPDGTVQTLVGEVYDDEDAWFAAMQRRNRAQRGSDQGDTEPA